MLKIKCPCCGYYTHEIEFKDKPLSDVCEVCYWQYDLLCQENPSQIIGANHISLEDAKRNYEKIGACEEMFSDLVRGPLPDEHQKN